MFIDNLYEFNQLGEHERYLKKYGDLNSTIIPYYVCYVSVNDAKIKDSKTGEEKLESGSVIGLNTLINTNNSKIIIRNFKG